MCGRFFLNGDLENVITSFDLINKEEKEKYFNGKEIFPSNTAPIIKADNKLYFIKWGFTLKSNKNLIINARSESIEDKYLFKKALKNRCVIPANGFYEWKGEKGSKIKYKISLKDEEIFSMAALYDTFLNEKGEAYEAFTIITTEANEEMSEIHHRMPVMFKLGEEKAWLAGDDNLEEILKPYKDGSLKIAEDSGYEQMSLLF
ncbi:SOS response-associated peptidase [uncultured Clostridium sp.]|uniref:SOS response-associated peptidase n=1 Tax=uncultured Clostridium sp. TaxID=59620 RepID=UPI0028E75E19|nr:SOS response-associated peptidase [uncultured Clostridium sp.]